MEKEVRKFIKCFKEQGFLVKREKLSRGLSYRVKSGSCTVVNDEVFYLDKRLDSEQQLGLLVDLARAKKITLDQELIASLPKQFR